MTTETTTPTENPIQSLSFGGMTPNFTDAESSAGNLSIVEPETPAAKLTVVNDASKPSLTGDAADQRSAKIQFALQDKAPAKEIIDNALASGREDVLRAQAASTIDLKDRQTQMEAIREMTKAGPPTDIKAQADLTALARFTPRNDPNTVFEQGYANNLVNSIPGLRNGDNVLATEGITQDPEKLSHSADIGQSLITKQEIAKSAYEDFHAIAKEQGWGGYAVDFAKGFVPGYSWYKTYNAVEGTPTAGPQLQGANWAEQIQHLYMLPPSEMHTALRETLGNLSKDNPQLAAEFAGAVVSYSSTDAFVHNIGNIVDVGTAIPVGAVANLTRRAVFRTAEEIAAAKLTGEAYVQAYKDVVKANGSPSLSIPDVLSASGDIKAAALANVQSRASEILGKETTKALDTAGLRRELPSIFNPKAFLDDGSNLSAMQTARLAIHLQNNADKVLERVANLTKVNRLPEEALQVAFREAQDDLSKRFAHVQDSVVDLKFNPPSENLANVGSVSAYLGDREGNAFSKPEQAYNYARGFLRLHSNDVQITQIEQRGVGYYIRVDRHLDETSEGVRSALLTTENTTPEHLGPLGWLKSGSGRVSQLQQENRIASVSAQQGLVSAFKEMAKDVSGLSKKSRDAVQRVMDDNRSVYNEVTEKTGVFHNTVSDFQDNFQRLNGRVASPKEVQAYFTSVQINDFDYLMRNMSLYRDRARQGVETFRLKHKVTDDRGYTSFHETQPFLGKYIDDLPLAQSDSKYPATVSIHTEGVEPQTIPLAQMDTAERRAFVQELKDKGYKIIQTYNPSRKPGSELFGEDPVNFIITKDYTSHGLDFQQLPYRPGWHQEYQQPWFVKQPVIRRVEGETGKHHVYEGDTTAMGFYTEAEAKKYAKAYEEARQILSGEKPGNLSEFIAKNLPMSEREFRGYFEPDADGKVLFNKNDPFVHTYTGSTTSDKFRLDFEKRYEGFNDTIRSPWNLMDKEDKKFVGQRDETLWTVKEGKGTEGNPAFQLDTASTIDPFASLSRGMTNIMRNRFMSDYKISAVESWAQEFGHLIQADSREDLFNNATHYLHNPTYVQKDVQNAAELSSAELSRRAVVEFLGSQSPEQTALDRLKANLLNTVYSVGGQEWSNALAPRILASEVDPLKAMRGFAFHTSIGLFNPVQLWQNAQTMANAVAIGGRYGLQGFAGGNLMNFLRLNQTEAVLNKMASVAGKMGYKEEWFKEAWQEYKNTGRLFVEGEHAWKDDVADPKFFSGTLGNILDKGQIFFREGEKASRTTAWATAYLEWRSANPEAKLTAAVRNSILRRSDDMTGNMTRASQAAWQQGVFSVPSQFLGYNARLMELMLGKRLSLAEKTRLFGVNAALYGVPVATGLGVGGVWNPYEDVRSYLVDKGVNVDDKVLDTVHNGVLGLMTSAITGRANSISEKSGPGGTTYFRDILHGDKSFMEAVMSVSLSKTGDALTSTMPLLRSLGSAAMGDPKAFPLVVTDAMDILRNVSSFDNATKTYIALTTGKMISKNGLYQGDVNSSEAIISALTGGKPRELTDTQIMSSLMKEDKKHKDAISKEISRNYTAALQAALDHDDVNYDNYMQRVSTLFQVGDYREDEKAQVLKKIIDENTALTDRVPFEFAIKKAPPSVATDRYSRWLNSGNKSQ